MKLMHEFLSNGAVICPMEETGKWPAIEASLKALPKVAEEEIKFEDALDSIKERERQEAATLLENDVAIPHGILPDPTPVMCTLAVSPQGITYGNNREKAKIMFTILGSQGRRREYLGLLAQIARLFRGRELKESILAASSPEEVIRIIRETEEQ